jgi:RmlD substrate binding domain
MIHRDEPLHPPHLDQLVLVPGGPGYRGCVQVKRSRHVLRSPVRALILLDAVHRKATGVLHLTAAGACSWYQFIEAIMELAGVEVQIESVATEIFPGGVDRPLNGVLGRPRADSLGVPVLRHWREALEDYMSRAGLAAGKAPLGGAA